MKLSVVIPAYNERKAIGPTLRQLHDHLGAESIDHEILVINDHSTDGTDDVFRRWWSPVTESIGEDGSADTAVSWRISEIGSPANRG
jgi:hypothetical protein